MRTNTYCASRKIRNETVHDYRHARAMDHALGLPACALLHRLNPAAETQQLLDEHLPYAIALEVREAWGDHLAQTFLVTTVMR